MSTVDDCLVKTVVFIGFPFSGPVVLMNSPGTLWFIGTGGFLGPFGHEHHDVWYMILYRIIKSRGSSPGHMLI